MSVQIACEIDGLPDEATLQRWPALVVNHLAAHFEYQQELTVRLVGEEEGRALNQQFRGRDKATNVLSFPAGMTFELPGDDARPLGDLVLCAPVVLQEAAAQGKEPACHWAHLLVHGTLHLMGYDHEDAADAERMEALEVEILAGQGLGNPYIERESDR